MRVARVKDLPLTAVLLAAVLVGGCSERAPAGPGRAARLEGMRPAGKRSAIASGFPVQVPVLDATVVDAAETEPGAAWIYEMETTATAAEAAGWYVGMYQAANWQLTRGGESLGADEGPADLVFAKGGARSTVRIAVVDGRTRISVSVGVGASPPTVY